MATNRLLTTEQLIKVAIPRMILPTVIVVSVFAQTHTTTRQRKEAVEEQPAELIQAEEAIQKDQLAVAEPLLKRTLERDPKNYQAWFDLGFIYNRLNRTDDSIQAYRQSVAAKPDVFESNLNLGLMLARSRNPEAEQFLRAATTLKPVAHVEEGQARAWLSLGHLIQETKPDDALAAYEKAATLTPRDTEPHLSAALLLEHRKNFSGAEAAYKQVLALDPHSVEAAVGLTNVYMKAGRLAEAEPLLRGLVSLRADDADLHLQLGRVLAAQGKKDQAIPEFETTLQLAPGDREAQRDLADLLTQSGKLADAEKTYRALLTANPNDADLHHVLGGVLLKQRQFPEAQKEFETAVRLKPDFGEAYGSLAIAANENKNYPLAIKALDARDQLLPPLTVGYFLRATAFDHLHDFKQASDWYHRFLDTAKGQYPDQEWQARHRLIAIDPKKH